MIEFKLILFYVKSDHYLIDSFALSKLEVFKFNDCRRETQYIDTKKNKTVFDR